MISYHYRGRDANGRMVTGQIKAESATEVASQLAASGLTPIRISPGIAGSGSGLSALMQTELFSRAPGHDDMMLFARQMYSLTKSGVPIVRALRGLAESSRNPMMVRALEDIVESLNAGRDLATSMARHPKIFNGLFVNVVRVAENSGRLDEAFLRLYHYMAFDANTKKKIVAALRYPAIVIVAVAIAIGVIMTMVVPSFARAFASFNAELPMQTQVIIGVSEFVVTYWYVVIAAIVALVIGARIALASDAGKHFNDSLKLRLPVLGSIVQRATLARFARSFAMIIKAGVPLMEGLSLVSRAVDNEVMGSKIQRMRESVERGDTLTVAARTCGMFTPLVIQMLSVGEETGRVDEMMDEVADYYDREVSADVENLSALLEPILIIVVGGVVLLLALGVFLPMWDLAGAAMGR